MSREDPREKEGKNTTEVIYEDHRSRELKIRVQTGSSFISLTQKYDTDQLVPWGKVVDTSAEGTDGSGYILKQTEAYNLRYREIQPIVRDNLIVGFKVRAECYSESSFGRLGIWEVKFKYFWRDM